MAATTRPTTLADRALVRLSGDDVRGFLQGLVTSDLACDLPVWAGLLTPQGKCLFDFIVWSDGDDVLLDCERDTAGDLAQRLSLYRLRRNIQIDRQPSLCVHWSTSATEGLADPRLPELGRRWLAPEDCTVEEAREVSNRWLEHRLSLGVCEGRAELADILWLECNAAELNGVSFTKGCFIGQENTARMNWRGKVNRRLFVVIGGGGERTRVEYPEVDRSVVHARVDSIPDNAVIPDWLRPALAQPSTA